MILYGESLVKQPTVEGLRIGHMSKGLLFRREHPIKALPPTRKVAPYPLVTSGSFFLLFRRKENESIIETPLRELELLSPHLSVTNGVVGRRTRTPNPSKNGITIYEFGDQTAAITMKTAGVEEAIHTLETMALAS
ncbi:hypothetical protein Tco_1188256 [Tanacetum coccineum]